MGWIPDAGSTTSLARALTPARPRPYAPALLRFCAPAPLLPQEGSALGVARCLSLLQSLLNQTRSETRGFLGRHGGAFGDVSADVDEPASGSAGDMTLVVLDHAKHSKTKGQRVREPVSPHPPPPTLLPPQPSFV